MHYMSDYLLLSSQVVPNRIFSMAIHPGNEKVCHQTVQFFNAAQKAKKLQTLPVKNYNLFLLRDRSLKCGLSHETDFKNLDKNWTSKLQEKPSPTFTYRTVPYWIRNTVSEPPVL
jgi:hypothetical protein